MTEFKIGDKVRSKMDHNLTGTVSGIAFDFYGYGRVNQIVTVRVECQTEIQINVCDIEKIDEEMERFEVGDIVVHKRSGLIYQIYSVYPGDDNGYNLERFTDDGVRVTRIYILPDEIRLADMDEILEFYRLKESRETGIHMNFNEYYPTLEFSKELMKSKEEKEINDMRKFKIGDVVIHWIFGKGTVIGYEKCLDIRVEFEDYSIKVLHEDSCSLVSRGREFHDLCGHVQNMPKFKQVIYNDPATIIFWEDGTKTVVKCEGEKYDEIKGLTMGIVKKIYGLKKFYNIYEDVTKYVTGKKTLLNIEKGLAESVVKDLYGIKKINSKDDIYKVAMTDGFYISTERK